MTRKGSKIPLGVRKKMSEAHKKIGAPWMLGKKPSEETRRKISEARKGKMPKNINQIKGWNKGKKISEETKKKIGLKALGNKNNLGKHWKIKDTSKMGKHIVGSKNPRWKGGITPINQKIRMSLEYRNWRLAVFINDNYACVECGARNGNGKKIILNADHYPIPFSAIVNKLIIEQGLENLYEKALAYDLFWNVDNGRTLCRPCHEKTFVFFKKLL